MPLKRVRMPFKRVWDFKWESILPRRARGVRRICPRAAGVSSLDFFSLICEVSIVKAFTIYSQFLKYFQENYCKALDNDYNKNWALARWGAGRPPNLDNRIQRLCCICFGLWLWLWLYRFPSGWERHNKWIQEQAAISSEVFPDPVRSALSEG